MIKIGSNQSVKAPKHTKRAASSLGAFSPDGPSDARNAGTSPANSALTLGALIALQGSDQNDQQDSRSKTVAWSSETLGLLEVLQRDLMTGEGSAEALQALAQAVALQQNSVEVPEDLKQIQDQILLRARVELAKRAS